MNRRRHFAGHVGALLVGVSLVILGAPRAAHAQQPYELDVAAPQLIGGPWLNTPRNQPIKLASLRGKVTIVEFWTFG
jgi:hypothetical protein